MGACDVSTGAPNSVLEIPDPNMLCTDIQMPPPEEEKLCAPKRAPCPLHNPVKDGLDDHPFSGIQTFFLLLGVFSVFCFFFFSSLSLFHFDI